MTLVLAFLLALAAVLLALAFSNTKRDPDIRHLLWKVRDEDTRLDRKDIA